MNHDTTFPGHTQAAISVTAPGMPSKAPRFDMYCAIHKALRQCMAHTLHRMGALDASEDVERNAVLDDVESLLATLRGHLQHENDFVHTAIEARQPGGARQTADDHVEHQEAIRNLEDEVSSLRHAHDEHRPQLALSLYRHLAAFIGENLMHMQVEETRGNTTLWALYSDEELVAIHDRLVASIAPAEMGHAVRWMAAALSVPELVAVFSDMRGKAPPPAFEAMLGGARTQLDERRWAQLARALGQPPVPGQVTV